jgi:hypothetical protein
MGLCKSGLKLSLLAMGGRDGRAAIARVAGGVWDVVGVVDGVVVAGVADSCQHDGPALVPALDARVCPPKPDVMSSAPHFSSRNCSLNCTPNRLHDSPINTILSLTTTLLASLVSTRAARHA